MFKFMYVNMDRTECQVSYLLRGQVLLLVSCIWACCDAKQEEIWLFSVIAYKSLLIKNKHSFFRNEIVEIRNGNTNRFLAARHSCDIVTYKSFSVIAFFSRCNWRFKFEFSVTLQLFEFLFINTLSIKMF